MDNGEWRMDGQENGERMWNDVISLRSSLRSLLGSSLR